MTFELDNLLKNHSTVGIIGNRSTAKSSLILHLLLNLREKYPHLKIGVMGICESLNPLFEQENITVLSSKMDILDLQLKDFVIFIDEMALFFETQTRNKQLSKLQRFFDRIEHQNCKMIVGTAREGYFNKFMCSRITAFITKQIEYESLVNGTWIKERIKAISSISDYRLVVDKSDYYVITAGDGMLTHKYSFPYDPRVDTKKENINLFEKVKEKEKKKVKGGKK